MFSYLSLQEILTLLFAAFKTMWRWLCWLLFYGNLRHQLGLSCVCRILSCLVGASSTVSTLHLYIFESFSAANYPSALSLSVSIAHFIKPVCLALPIVSEMPSVISMVSLASTAANTRPLSTISTVLAGNAYSYTVCEGSSRFPPCVLQHPYYCCCQLFTGSSNGFSSTVSTMSRPSALVAVPIFPTPVPLLRSVPRTV